MLNGYSPQLAKRKAPPAAEKTEKSKGALIPRAPVIVTANSRSKTPLKKAVLRVCHPSTSRIPRSVSAQVATMARVGTVAVGKNQLSCLVSLQPHEHEAGLQTSVLRRSFMVLALLHLHVCP